MLETICKFAILLYVLYMEPQYGLLILYLCKASSYLHNVSIIIKSNVRLTLSSTFYSVILVRQPRASTRYVRHRGDNSLV